MNPKVSNVSIVIDTENIDATMVVEALEKLIGRIKENGLTDKAIYNEVGNSIGCMEVNVPTNQ